MAYARSKRTVGWAVARNAWIETRQDLLTTTLGAAAPAEPPPPQIVEWKDDYYSAALHSRRGLNEGNTLPLNLNLLGQDIIYQAQGQAAVFSEEPRWRDLSSERLRQDWAWREVGYIGLDQFYGTDGQTPIFAEEPRWRSLAEERTRQDWTWRETGYLGLDTFYGDMGEAPVFVEEPRFRAVRLERLTEQWEHRGVDVLGLDTFYGDSGQSPTFVEPALFIIRGNRIAHVPNPLNLQGTLFTTPEEIPSGKQWQDPILVYKGRAHTGYILQGLGNNVLFGTDEVPGKQFIPDYLRRAIPIRLPEYVLQGMGNTILFGTDEVPGKFYIPDYLRRSIPARDYNVKLVPNNQTVFIEPIPDGEQEFPDFLLRYLGHHAWQEHILQGTGNTVLLGTDEVPGKLLVPDYLRRAVPARDFNIKLIPTNQTVLVELAPDGQQEFSDFLLRYIERHAWQGYLFPAPLNTVLFGVESQPDGNQVYADIINRILRQAWQGYILQSQVNTVLFVTPPVGPPAGTLTLLGVGV